MPSTKATGSLAPATIPAAPTPSASALKQQRLKRLLCSAMYEEALALRGFRAIAGVDEVGRGALIGSVITAAVILPANRAIVRELIEMGLKDSKQLTEKKREALDAVIRRYAVSIALGEADAATIDRINIYHATRLAMRLAVEGLSPQPDHLLIDAMKIEHPCPQTSLTHGDALSVSIAAASVVAKVYRDGLMRALDREHPAYGLTAHKGYGTAKHLHALALHGPLPLHRFSFAPVAAAHATHSRTAKEPAPCLS